MLLRVTSVVPRRGASFGLARAQGIESRIGQETGSLLAGNAFQSLVEKIESTAAVGSVQADGSLAVEAHLAGGELDGLGVDPRGVEEGLDADPRDRRAAGDAEAARRIEASASAMAGRHSPRRIRARPAAGKGVALVRRRASEMPRNRRGPAGRIGEVVGPAALVEQTGPGFRVLGGPQTEGLGVIVDGAGVVLPGQPRLAANLQDLDGRLLAGEEGVA